MLIYGALFFVTCSASFVVAAASALLPTSFKWSSSGALIGPKADSRNLAALKDPSVVYYNGKYHVFVSTASSAGYNLAYLSFTDFNSAGSASLFYLDQSAIGTGYRAAPQVFFFAPQNKWYMIFQNGNCGYSTNSDISNPSGWSAVKNFYSGSVGNNLDFWNICDSTNCYIFSSADDGKLYRSQTSVANFPNGMSQPTVIMSDSQNALFEASNVYKIDGQNQYLLIVEAIGSDGQRYFRSWTSSSLTGTWSALANTEANPFARSNNVAFSGTPWTKSISHGEMVRTNVDQTMTISSCNMRYLYQGLSPSASGDYNSLPWRLGLLTATNSPC